MVNGMGVPQLVVKKSYHGSVSNHAESFQGLQLPRERGTEDGHRLGRGCCPTELGVLISYPLKDNSTPLKAKPKFFWAIIAGVEAQHRSPKILSPPKTGRKFGSRRQKSYHFGNCNPGW
jgi:hypothetical protein